MARSWKSGTAYCAGTNRSGQPCGNKIAVLPSGVAIYRYCYAHRKKWKPAPKDGDDG